MKKETGVLNWQEAMNNIRAIGENIPNITNDLPATLRNGIVTSTIQAGMAGAMAETEKHNNKLNNMQIKEANTEK